LFFFQIVSGTHYLIAQNILKNKIDFLQVKEGISKRPISEITQDKDGFLWIGTQGNGLYRFDGVHHKNYINDEKDLNTVDSNFIYGVFVDSKNRIWVGTKRGLNLYNRDLDKFVRISLGNVAAVDNSIDVKCMIEDDIGNLIIGTYGKGVFKLSPQTMCISKVKIGAVQERELIVHQFAKSTSGEIYMASRIGLFVFNNEKDSIAKKSFNFKNETRTLDLIIRSLLFDPDDNLWIGTDENGIFKNDNSGNLLAMPILKKKVLSMLYKNNTLFLGTENDGLLLVDQNGTLIKRYTYNYLSGKGIDSDSVWELFEDKEGRVWIGYFDKGVAVYDPFSSKFNDIKYYPNDSQSLQGNSISAIKEDSKGMLWLGLDGGLDIYNPKTGYFEHINKKTKGNYQGLTSSAVLDIFIDSEENLWVGTWDAGVFLLKKGSNTFENFNTLTPDSQLTNDVIFDFTEDSKGNVFMASFLEGVHYYSAEEEKFYHCNLQPFINLNLDRQDVRVVFADSKDNIWIGTQNDVLKLKMTDDKAYFAERIKPIISDKLKNNSVGIHVLSFYESKNGTIYIGTNGNGLLSYNPENKKFRDYSTINGLEETVVNSVLEVDESLLIITGNLGVTRIDLKENTAYALDKDDGLHSTNFNNGAILKDSKGIVYIGSFEGINYFDPKTVNFNTIAPKPYLSNIKIFNQTVSSLQPNSPLEKEISQTKKISLNHRQSVFTIDYSSINFTRPESTTYAYMLDGFDENWNFVGNTTHATYTNIKAGSYTFKVKASNNDGIWSETPTTLKINVLPPWWRTLWAKGLYVLGGILIFWTGIQLRIKYVKKKTEQQYELQLMKLINQEEGRHFEKSRVALELHDGVLSSLFGIRMGLDNINNHDTDPQKPERQVYLKKLFELEKEIRNLSHGLNSHIAISDLAFTTVIEKVLQEQCPIHHLNYSIDSDPRLEFVNVNNSIKYNMYRIIQESLQNIIRHSKASLLSISFSMVGQYIALVIKDNGIGFNPNKEFKGIGIKNMKSRVKSLGGNFQYQNAVSGGTIIKIEIPLEK